MSAPAIRILGRVDTPPAVARELARRTLSGLPARVSVLDPACGAAPLLVAAAEAARAAGQIATLAGLDKDPLAVAEAREALAARGLRARLRVRDALALPPGGRLPGFPRGFDAVLANPPWVSFSGREAVALGADAKARLRARFESFRGWPALPGPFLEVALDLVRPGGRVGFVLPRQVLDLAGYEALRRAATARARVLDVNDLGEDVFVGVCEPSATVVLERLSPDEDGRASGEPWAPQGPPGGRGLPRWALRTLERLARFPRFPRALLSDPGVHTGNAAARVLSRLPRDGFAPCREGKDVRAFSLGAPRLFVEKRPRLARPLYARVGDEARYARAAVLVRQTADRPIAARHEPPAHFRNSALAVSGAPGLPVEVFLALLNSRLFALDHRARAADARQRAFPQVKVGALARLPFPASLSEGTRERLVRLVRRREALARLDRALEAEVAGLDRALEAEVARLFGVDGDAARALGEWLP